MILVVRLLSCGNLQPILAEPVVGVELPTLSTIHCRLNRLKGELEKAIHHTRISC